ncbi:DUF5710 domain-containing protein [Iodobacter sp. CM08]|uniref:DUF5710 domain-containing protein n=1 Tax=Iodobacter sp. CM08 TaxID=3085902 RepID=UPI002982577F|nr:DUF5710 domain-containing protein [Iodobacter sp. CM08]MDW5417396.1 DUF5710 domain-containing protein [Iodobacter sp. CM08]
MRINLKVPFAEKDSAKALGARWDAAKKLWFIVDKPDLSPFLQWMDASSVEQKTAKVAAPIAAPLPKIAGVDYGEPPWEVTANDIILK